MTAVLRGDLEHERSSPDRGISTTVTARRSRGHCDGVLVRGEGAWRKDGVLEWEERPASVMGAAETRRFGWRDGYAERSLAEGEVVPGGGSSWCSDALIKAGMHCLHREKASVGQCPCREPTSTGLVLELGATETDRGCVDVPGRSDTTCGTG